MFLAKAYSRREILEMTAVGAGSLTAAGILASCGGGTAAPSATQVQITDQLGWLKITQFSGFLAADAQGYYQKANINATIQPGGPNIIASQVVGAGRTLVGDDDNTTALQAIDKGTPVMIYGAIFQKSPYAVMSLPEAPIRTLQDFAGKTVAMSEATKPQLFPLLQKAGVNPNTVKVVPAGPDPSQLASHQVQGYFGYATAQGVTLLQQGLPVIFTYLTDLGLPTYANVLITRAEVIDKQADLLTRFLRCVAKGYWWSNQNPDQMGQLMANKYGTGLKADTESAVAKAQATLIDSPKGPLWVDTDRMAQIISNGVAQGTISKSLPINQVVTTKILEAAYKGWSVTDPIR
jgi:NitT/TauT family transport system substrate-binding protein